MTHVQCGTTKPTVSFPPTNAGRYSFHVPLRLRMGVSQDFPSGIYNYVAKLLNFLVQIYAQWQNVLGECLLQNRGTANSVICYACRRLSPAFVCLSVCLFVCQSVCPHDISKTAAARIIKFDTQMLHHDSWKTIYFWNKRSMVNVTRQKQCRRGFSILVSAGFF